MNIALDFSPLNGNNSQHSVRGVGFYMQRLQKALLEYVPEHTYSFLSRLQDTPLGTDLLHIPYFDPFFLHLQNKKALSTVVTIHDLTPLVFPRAFPRGIKGEIKWQIQKHRVCESDAIITDSNASKKDILKLLHYPEKKVFVVYLAADDVFREIKNEESQIKHIKEKYQLPEKFVLYVGDATWNKNLPRLIRAIDNASVHMITVGKALVDKTFDRNNPWNHDLGEFQRLSEQSSNVQNLGFVETEDLVQLYNLATVAIMPSLYEGFGLPVLEAMQSGCPVITTERGSLPEVAGDAAMYVDPENIANISDGIQTMLQDENIRQAYREKGLIQAKKFSWEKTAKQTAAVYKTLYKKGEE